MVNCEGCGARLDENDQFCPECGAKIVKVHPAQKYDPLAAAILGFFFGPLGYIYVGRYLRILLGAIIGLILLAATQGKAILALPFVFALDCYRIAKKGL